jgi:C4-dicarboxylate-specific signal transduction histidine kinase
MHALRDIPIQRKLRVVILATCSAALVVACGVLFGLQLLLVRRHFEQDLAAVAEIIASNSVEALQDADEEHAREILGSLKAKPFITGAVLVLEDGTPFVQRGDAILPEQRVALPAPGLQEFGGEPVYVHPVTFEGRQLGTLLLHPDYRAQANELVRVFAGILSGVLAVSLLVAVVVSRRLEHVILDPLSYLGKVAKRIARRNDYSLRAQKFVEDELGAFTDAFNGMLAQIEQRDTALRHEIAERTRAEAELQRVHRQLVEASRQAGMAEVATGVLHNVGNVLNSVNVSASLLAEKFSRSKVAHLAQATAMLREQGGDAARFLLEDPKGRLLPGYFAEISAHLGREQSEACAELERLHKHVEHIKEIVAMQQTYARVAGFLEPLSLQDLVEDALAMDAGSFERHGVWVVRDYACAPVVLADKHRALQVLVNVFRNARQAMSEKDDAERRLTISIGPAGGRLTEVRIRDCGIGIAPENLTRIFSHGFTTRKGGHGFGLHSAALAAQQLGGRLRAESAGLGCGATFILELPLATPASIPAPAAA